MAETIQKPTGPIKDLTEELIKKLIKELLTKLMKEHMKGRIINKDGKVKKTRKNGHRKEKRDGREKKTPVSKIGESPKDGQHPHKARKQQAVFCSNS